VFILLFFPLALQPQFGPWPTSMKLSVSFRFFLDFRQSVGLFGRVISSSQGLYLYTNTGKCTHMHKHLTSMPWVGFEPTIPGSELAKTVHAADRSPTVTGSYCFRVYNNLSEQFCTFFEDILPHITLGQ
jgi:hypothetical protein